MAGAVNAAGTGNAVSVTLDAASSWTVTGTSYLTALTDADSTHGNIICQSSPCLLLVSGGTTTAIK